jgi:hypothetical protein
VLAVDRVPSRPERPEGLIVVYDGGVLSDADVKEIVLADGELAGFAFVARDEVAGSWTSTGPRSSGGGWTGSRQSGRYELWRVSHAYHPQVAVRLICWFPPGTGTVVVALTVVGSAQPVRPAIIPYRTCATTTRVYARGT